MCHVTFLDQRRSVGARNCHVMLFIKGGQLGARVCHVTFFWIKGGQLGPASEAQKPGWQGGIAIRKFLRVWKVFARNP